MRVVVITQPGSYDVLQVQERPNPICGPGQVRVQVAAAGVNFADIMARLGVYPDAPKTPSVVGYEVSGTVAQVGDGVTSAKVGDRVMAGTQFGGYAEQVVVPAADVVPLPDRLTFEQGAAIPVNYATAWAGLVGYGSLREGDRVLLHAAAGGVGIAATQIARKAGAEVWGTASPHKHDAIRGFGVQHPLDYTRKGWEKGLPSFDLIMDAVGGESLRRSYKQLRAGGRVVAFGASSVVNGEKRSLRTAAPQALRMVRGFNLMDQMQESKTVIGLNMLTLWKDRGTLEPWVTPLLELIEDGTIEPVVSDAVPFTDAGEAHRIITERRNVGKVVLVP
ncbi:Narbonolide/10-deoxymethynolide synthase PikA2, modules 3 and 4 [Paraconexibacter sp. AEG42_29]|uniref:Narbonolide/10-deoxymethynolide synthase PikA2, modules 3 and 4 n=1 Tax=Paraconexibacter sp. AEG42_29 TaxID=2997339 RepID=A0AAU7AV91_9ACTN